MGSTIETHDLENEALLVETARTDRRSFDVLYDHYFPRVYGYVYKRTSHRESAEDIVSATFLKVFSKLHTYSKKDCGFGAWVFRIATNELIDYYRRQGRKKETVLDETVEAMPDTAPAPLETVAQQEDARRVRAVLKELPERYQQVLYLKFFSDLSHAEMAAALGVSVNNVGVLVYRSLEKFHKLYSRYVA